MAFSVRRMAAVDLHGVRGGRGRRILVTVEFFAALGLGVGLGVWLLVRSAPWPWAMELLGDGLNYLPLMVHAVRLLPADTLERELTGVDLGSQLRRYAVANLLLLVPGLLVVASALPGEWRPVPRRADVTPQ